MLSFCNIYSFLFVLKKNKTILMKLKSPLLHPSQTHLNLIPRHQKQLLTGIWYIVFRSMFHSILYSTNDIIQG